VIDFVKSYSLAPLAPIGPKRPTMPARRMGRGKGVAAPFPARHCSDPKRVFQRSVFAAFPFRIDSPFSSTRCALCAKRSRMPSATVASPICSCQFATGTCDGGSWSASGIDPRRFPRSHGARSPRAAPSPSHPPQAHPSAPNGSGDCARCRRRAPSPDRETASSPGCKIPRTRRGMPCVPKPMPSNFSRSRSDR
jgi:hypothetical protein